MRKLKDKFYRAQKHVKCVRDFYTHLIVYLVINISISSFIVYNKMWVDGELFNQAFFDFSTFAIWLFWGIGLSIQGFKVFGLPFIFGRNWENEKIKEFMEEETNNRWE